MNSKCAQHLNVIQQVGEQQFEWNTINRTQRQFRATFSRLKSRYLYDFDWNFLIVVDFCPSSKNTTNNNPFFKVKNSVYQLIQLVYIILPFLASLCISSSNCKNSHLGRGTFFRLAVFDVDLFLHHFLGLFVQFVIVFRLCGLEFKNLCLTKWYNIIARNQKQYI